MPQFDRSLRLLAPGVIVLLFAIAFDATSTGQPILRAMKIVPAGNQTTGTSTSVDGMSSVHLAGMVILAFAVSFLLSSCIPVFFRRWPFDLEASYSDVAILPNGRNVFETINQNDKQNTGDSTSLNPRNLPLYAAHSWSERESAVSVFRVSIVNAEIAEWLQRRAHQVWIGATTCLGLLSLCVIELWLFDESFSSLVGNRFAFGVCLLVSFGFSLIFAGTCSIAVHEIREMTLYCLRRSSTWKPTFKSNDTTDAK